MGPDTACSVCAGALTSRLLGQPWSHRDGCPSEGLSLHAFLGQHPKLGAVLLEELKVATAPTSGGPRLHPALHAVLTLLAQLQPGADSPVRYGGSEDAVPQPRAPAMGRAPMVLRLALALVRFYSSQNITTWCPFCSTVPLLPSWGHCWGWQRAPSTLYEQWLPRLWCLLSLLPSAASSSCSWPSSSLQHPDRSARTMLSMGTCCSCWHC